MTPMETAVARYLRHVSIERGLSANTVGAYRRDLEGYARWLADHGIREPASVAEGDVTAYLAWLRSPVAGEDGRPALSASSSARMLSAVRGLHRFLLEEGLTEADAAAEVRPPKLGSRLPKAISIADVQALLAATDGEEPERMRDKALLELLYATGARVSEAVALNVDDTVDAEAVRLFGKGGKERIVPVGGYARRALATYLVRGRPAFSSRGRATPALFLGSRGARLSRQSAWLIIRRAAESAGLGGAVSPHTLRHSFATHLLAGGADVRVVQELLGHSSVATTQIYTQLTADTLRDMYTSAHPRSR